MLKITSDGRKLGLDPRLIDPSFEDNPDTKLNRCVENVARIYQETAEDRLTQIIFCDLGVPHIDMELTQYSKLISDIPTPDIAISMGCDVGCPFIGRPYDEDWGLPDPTGKDDAEFERIIALIEENVLKLVQQITEL